MSFDCTPCGRRETYRARKGRKNRICLLPFLLSRSYYGAYCLARDLLISKGFDIPRIDAHRAVREAFQQGSNRVIKKVGEDLRRLWGERKNADYDAPQSFDKVRPEKALKLAKRLLALYSDHNVQKVAP